MYRSSHRYKKGTDQRSRIQGQNQDNVAATPLDHELPELRRVIEITDYDSGQPATHHIELYRSDRIDCYRAVVDSRLWKARIGWSRVLEGLRKALPRLRQFD